MSRVSAVFISVMYSLSIGHDICVGEDFGLHRTGAKAFCFVCFFISNFFSVFFFFFFSFFFSYSAAEKRKT